MGNESYSVASPGSYTFTYIPSQIPPRAERAINKFFSMNESGIRELMAHVVDYRALIDLNTAVNAWPTESKAEIEKLKVLSQAIAQQLGAIRSRRKAVFETAAKATRREGEERQRVLEHLYKHLPAREQERLLHSWRLWDDSAVYVDVDTIPSKPHPDDMAELALKNKMAPVRVSKGFSHSLFEIDSLAHLEVELYSLAEEIAGTGHFGVIKGVANEAVSFIRELRFFGHGSSGTATKQPTFHACGVLSSDKIDISWLLGLAPDDDADAPSADAATVLGQLQNYLCPGATIFFEGCSVGKGDAGKQFLALVGHHCFGDFKFGFLKANTEETFTLSAAPEEGLPPVSPVTYKWPDDLRKIANMFDIK
ncbi:MAG: hypothetical protein R3F48_00300 [Candidatus Zixiibacteriota bacterium]